MQTFLPYADFNESAKVLDRARLGKQRVEAIQILKTISNGGGWAKHPAIRMWRNHEESLILYGLAICDEWISRGYKDGCKSQLLEQYGLLTKKEKIDPEWLGNEEFHLSHKSNLMRKLPEHYKQFWPEVPNNLEYIWP